MKVVILAGGLGSRLGNLTNEIPKPMVEIGGKPILWHLMKYYSCFGFNKFILALGYKSNIIKDYFINYSYYNSDFSINTNSNTVKILNNSYEDWEVNLVDTGENTMTGGRIKRLQKLLKNEKTFMLTYGDGLSTIDIKKLVEFHNKEKKIITVSAVHPVARFGEIIIKNNTVINFQEKPQSSKGYINGGFFVCNNEIFNYISGDDCVFENKPLENLSKENELAAFTHKGFWHCLDTPRDKKFLDELCTSNDMPWKIWRDV